MDAVVGTAGFLCLLLGLGHETLGVVWVLPGLSREHLPKTPFGSLTMTESMIRATWHLITVFVWSMGALLLTIAFSSAPDTKTLLFRFIGTAWFAAAITASAVAIRRIRRMRDLFRLPVPLLFVVVGMLLWSATL